MIKNISNDESRDLNALIGTFIESGFTVEQVAQAVLADARFKGQINDCVFLSPAVAV